MRIRYKILSYSIIAMLLFSGGYLIAVYSNGGTPTIDTTGLSNFPWFNASVGVNAPEFYLNGELQYQEQTASYIIFKDGSTIYAKNGATGQIDYSGTDAAIVIQASIDALTNGGRIFIKKAPTNYQTDITLTITTQKIQIESNHAIIENSGTGNCINITSSNTRMYGIVFKGTVGSGSGIYLNASNCYFYDVETNSHGSHGLEQVGGNSNKFVLFASCSNGGVGVSISTTNGNDASFYGLNIASNTGAGVNLDSGASVRLTDGAIQHNGDSGIKIAQTANIMSPKISGLYFEGNTDNDILLGSSTHSVYNGLIEGCFFYSSTTNAINITSVSGLVIISPRFSGTYVNKIEYGAAPNNVIVLSDENKRLYVGTRSDMKDIYPIGTCWIGDDSNRYARGYFTRVYDSSENGGTQTCANNENIVHGLSGVPTMIQVTPMTDTYDGVPVIATVDWSGVTTTNIRVGLYWVNGTAISDDAILVSWLAYYKP